MTLETIGRCAAGYSFGCFRTETMHPFVEHMVEGLRGSDRLGVFRSTFLPRFIANHYERKVRRHAAYMHGIADEIIAARRAEGPGHHDDLLEIMLASDLDAANIRYQMINFLVAGHETTSGALSFALYFLSRHPEVFARARAEVDEVWGEQERPEFEQIAKLRYVRRVLDESLRLQPTVPGYYRAAREDTLLAGKYPMRKGDWAVVMVGALHRDPRWGPNPDEFDPDRFAPERVKARPGNLYKPFGTGERSCIGRQFALHEAVLILGMLIRRYDLIVRPRLRASDPGAADNDAARLPARAAVAVGSYRATVEGTFVPWDRPHAKDPIPPGGHLQRARRLGRSDVAQLLDMASDRVEYEHYQTDHIFPSKVLLAVEPREQELVSRRDDTKAEEQPVSSTQSRALRQQVGDELGKLLMALLALRQSSWAGAEYLT